MNASHRLTTGPTKGNSAVADKKRQKQRISFPRDAWHRFAMPFLQKLCSLKAKYIARAVFVPLGVVLFLTHCEKNEIDHANSNSKNADYRETSNNVVKSKENVTSTMNTAAAPEPTGVSHAPSESGGNMNEIVALLNLGEFKIQDIPPLCEKLRNDPKYTFTKLNYKLILESDSVSKSSIILALGCLGDKWATQEIVAEMKSIRYSAEDKVSGRTLFNAILALSISSFYGEPNAIEEFSQILSGRYCTQVLKTDSSSESCWSVKTWSLNASPLTGQENIFKYIELMTPQELQTFYTPVEISSYASQRQNVKIVKKYGYPYYLNLLTRKGFDEAAEALSNNKVTVDDVWNSFGEVALSKASSMALTENLSDVAYKRANELICHYGLGLGKNHLKRWIERISERKNAISENPYREIIECLGAVSFNIEKAGGDPEVYINQLYSFLNEDVAKQTFKPFGRTDYKLFYEDVLMAIGNSGSEKGEKILKEIQKLIHTEEEKAIIEKAITVALKRKVVRVQISSAQKEGN